jgi:methionine-rich copper-binding protein CopC/putative copper export protein
MLTISLGILVSFSWLPFFSQAPAAFAHAFVIGSDPVDGSTIATAPSVIRIFFNADISPASNARVYVFAPGGPANGSEVDAGHSSIPANHARELDTPLIASTSLPQGSYEVKWSALALDDGHATNGLIGFNLGTSVTGLAGTPILGPSTSNYLPQLNVQGVLSVMWEWLTMLALLFWVGLVTMEGLFLLSARTNVDDTEGGVLVALRKQGRPLQWLCLSAILVGEIINLVLRGALLTQVHAQSGIDVGTIRQVVFETSYGLFWLARICLICIALGFLWWTTREQTRRQGVSPLSHTRATPLSQLRMQVMEERKKEESPAKEETGDATEQPELTPALIAALPTTPVVASPLPTRATRRVSVASWHTIAWLTLAALMLLTLAFSSDTAQLAQAHYSAIILTWLQLLAQAAWFGGAAYLGFVLLPSLTTLKPDHGDFLLNLLRYYTPLALTSLAVALLGSLFLVETTISNAQQWLNDAYGRSLLVMLLLFALMLIFTLYSFFYLRASLRRQVILLPVVNADLPGRRARHSALEQTENGLKHAMHILAALGAGVLLCGALMSFFAPPIVFPDVTYKLTITTDSTPQLNVLTQQVGNLTVSLEMQPGRVGVANTMIITLKDRGTSQPVTNARISAITNMQIMDMGTVNKELAAAGSNATYTTTFQPGEAFSMIGAWVISLNIQQPGRAAVQTQFVVTLTS